MDKNWRPEGWEYSYIDEVPHPHSTPELAERLSHRRAIARRIYEAGASAIIPFVEAEVKRVEEKRHYDSLFSQSGRRKRRGSPP